MVLEKMTRGIATNILGINHSKVPFFFVLATSLKTFAILGLNAVDVSSFSKMRLDAKCFQKLSGAPRNDLTNTD